MFALTRDGRVEQLHDDRLRRIAAQERHHYTEAGASQDAGGQWRQLVDAERAHRNRPGGYWIAEADPEAAAQARRQTWNLGDLAAIVVMTDGVSAGVDRYGTPADWPTAIGIARRDPQRVIDLVHDTEASDPDHARWPRSKRHDDKALAVIDFEPSPSGAH